MRPLKWLFGIILAAIWLITVIYLLRLDIAVVINPKGWMAHQELEVILINVALMLAAIAPTFLLLFLTVWRYSSKGAKYHPEKAYGAPVQLLFWIIPTIPIAMMAFYNWFETHRLDPHVLIQSSKKPLEIQVVALNWKWLFIYPEQGIAAVNFFQIPEETPVHLSLTADGAPMNSFWVPQLSGQIYCMTGMVTPLKIIADQVGEYAGKAAEINGEGYASMTFVAKATSEADFQKWVAAVKKKSPELSLKAYNQLAKRTVNHPVSLFANVEEGLFRKILNKYLQ